MFGNVTLLASKINVTATKCQKKVQILIYKDAIVNPIKAFFSFSKITFSHYVEIDMEFSMFNHDHTRVKFSRQMAKK